jgi:uncharacterized repeat protein (TIGR01451 family)
MLLLCLFPLQTLGVMAGNPLQSVLTPSGNLYISLYSPSQLNDAVGGDSIMYTITGSWVGDTAAPNVAITNILPPEVTLLSANPPASSQTGQTVQWMIDSISSSQDYVIEIIGRVQLRSIMQTIRLFPPHR